ncbi:MAG: hypothetical protein PHU46_15340 [Rhodocyclaceae bacterium]|nr:hypothetical protein [Rhodocyclaceae bacterium]
MKRFLRRLLTPPLMVLAALILFFEDWLWERLKLAMAAVGRLPGVRGLEARISGLGPGPALAVFLVPSLLIIPVKIGALWFIVHGHALGGVLVILAAKVAGMALFSRIFVLCRPVLLTVGWFRKMHDTLLSWLATLHAFMDGIPAWQAAKRRVHGWRETFRAWRARHGSGFLSRLWRALRSRRRP